MPKTRLLHCGALLAAASFVALPAAAQQQCGDLVEPPTMHAHGDTLRMAPATYRVGDSTFTTNVYNRHFVAPTIHIERGDTLRLYVVNAMVSNANQPDSTIAITNQHYHGLVVTPNPVHGDNVTSVKIARDTAWYFDFPVPVDVNHEGMYWYHPHPHGNTSTQVAGGLSGALMIGSILTYFPQYRGVRERTLLVRDMTFNGNSNPLLNVNGSTCVTMRVRRGHPELWHIGNFDANTFVNLKLPGMKWTLLGMDGNHLTRPLRVDSLYLAPGSRAEVIVEAPPATVSRVPFITAPVDASTPGPTDTLGYLVTEALPLGSARAASAVAEPPAGPEPAGDDALALATIRSLREAASVQKRRFTYQFLGNTSAGIDSTIYSPDEPPINVPIDSVQEWTLVNQTGNRHTFHIHQTDITIVSINGVPVTENFLRDNVPLGVHPDGNGNFAGDTVVVRFKFPRVAMGPFVFHCHVLIHEDQGMMRNVCAYDANDPDGQAKCNSYFSGNGGHTGHGGH
jgi:FtsP/CotA-like multicopper oxidase with cupredoxin domain